MELFSRPNFLYYQKRISIQDDEDMYINSPKTQFTVICVQFLNCIHNIHFNIYNSEDEKERAKTEIKEV